MWKALLPTPGTLPQLRHGHSAPTPEVCCVRPGGSSGTDPAICEPPIRLDLASHLRIIPHLWKRKTILQWCTLVFSRRSHKQGFKIIQPTLWCGFLRSKGGLDRPPRTTQELKKILLPNRNVLRYYLTKNVNLVWSKTERGRRTKFPVYNCHQRLLVSHLCLFFQKQIYKFWLCHILGKMISISMYLLIISSLPCYKIENVQNI